MRIHIEEKKYSEKVNLHDISLDLVNGAGEAILGPSGIGKSTLLRIIAGLDDDFKGEITGRPHAIAMVFQEPLLMNWRSARDNITLFTGATQADADAALASVQLSGLEERLPQELSVGQQRRVSLARALSARPELLILDEAFASLDHDTATMMRQLVAHYVQKNDAKLILATHEEDDLELAQNISSIQNGTLVSFDKA